VVDPGLGLGHLIDSIHRQGPTLARILLTHGHGDHIVGISELRQAFPTAPVCCPAAEVDLLTDAEKNLSALCGFDITVSPADELLEPGKTLTLDKLVWHLLDTSGHSPGGMSFYCRQAGVVLSGDALFAGSIGRTDIPGADEAALLSHIRANLLTLPDDTLVYPGHGPATTIGDERRQNPFLSAL
jgi:glyoxylase-like metal-dependent hydrolase (beta-lactamase superfamily II)